jgi:hypothetical protein
MKTIILGDIHGRSNWKDALSAHPNAERIIFMGDYFDSFDISGTDQLNNFNEIIRFKEETDKEVIMLIGNHDHHYMDIGETYSGYQAAMQWDFNDALKKNMNHLQIVYLLDDVLFTHAGISPVWMDITFDEWSHDTLVEQLNELYQARPILFNFSHLGGFDPNGNSIEQGPLWIRPRSLISSNTGDDGLKDHFRQVVGHTQVNNISDSFKATEKTMDSRYYLVDAMDSGGYAIYENKELKPIQL